jgi:hypothetical protein
MKRDFAQRGPGAGGAAVRRADGVLRPRAPRLRARDDGSRCGTFAVARTCDRTPGEPGICPLDAPATRPARCDADVLPAWMALFAVEHPVTDRAGLVAQRLARALAESVLMAGVPEAPADSAGFEAPRPGVPAASEGGLVGVRFDGNGGPMMQAAAVQLNATWGPGEKRQQQQAARVGGSDPADPTPRAPAALAELLIAPAAARARQQPADGTAEAPKAPQGRRVARLGRTQPAVLARSTAAADPSDRPPRNPVVSRLEGALGLGRRAPQLCPPWQRVTGVRDSMPVVGYRRAAANALCGDPSKAGQHGVQPKLTARLRGRVGDVLGGLRQSLTTPRRRQAVRQTLAQVITCRHNHRRWRPYDQSLALGLPLGTGVVASACGSVVTHRLAGAGKRWSLAGAEAMLALGSRKKRHDHDLRDSWRFPARQARLRLDGRQPNYRPTERLKRVA